MKISYSVYSLIGRLYSKRGIVVADYLETRDFLKALRNCEDFLRQHNDEMCEIIMTRTDYDLKGRAFNIAKFRTSVNMEGLEQ